MKNIYFYVILLIGFASCGTSIDTDDSNDSAFCNELASKFDLQNPSTLELAYEIEKTWKEVEREFAEKHLAKLEPFSGFLGETGYLNQDNEGHEAAIYSYALMDHPKRCRALFISKYQFEDLSLKLIAVDFNAEGKVLQSKVLAIAASGHGYKETAEISFDKNGSIQIQSVYEGMLGHRSDKSVIWDADLNITGQTEEKTFSGDVEELDVNELQYDAIYDNLSEADDIMIEGMLLSTQDIANADKNLTHAESYVTVLTNKKQLQALKILTPSWELEGTADENKFDALIGQKSLYKQVKCRASKTINQNVLLAYKHKDYLFTDIHFGGDLQLRDHWTKVVGKIALGKYQGEKSTLTDKNGKVYEFSEYLPDHFDGQELSLYFGSMANYKLKDIQFIE